MNRSQAGVLVLLVVIVLAPLTALGTGVGATGTGAPATVAIEADAVEFRITVTGDAAARWTFTYTRILEDDEERERFRAFAREFEENETDAYDQFRTQARALAANGRNATGREMSAGEFSRSAELGGNCVTAQDCGTVTMSFTWSAFAASDGDRLVVGDVFGTGLFLSSSQQLVFEAGHGLAFASASPEDYTPSGGSLAGSDSITYEGEQTFSDQRPRAVLVPEGQAGTPEASTPTPDGEPDTPGAGTGTPDREGGIPMVLIGGLIVVLVGAGAAIVWWRGDGAPAIPIGGGGDGGAPAQRAEAVPDEPSVPDEELLTDEDRVLTLLRDNGGRMKQVAIVDETGWSKSKVSMLLSEMEDDEHISKLRVGRENIISLAGHEPEAAGSPHEED